MKKTLVSALTTALVVGAAGTCFAAANPFSDVDPGHWAYEYVEQLVANGVVDGMGDGRFDGERSITRYEVAKMVAKAMAKPQNSVDQAMLDKLAAEFASELKNLGVRVAALEKKVDNVTWTGRIRYRTNHKDDGHAKERPTHEDNYQNLLFRLEPKATVNKHWFVQTRMDYSLDPRDAGNGNIGDINRLWAQGQYGKTTIKLGKIPFTTQADYGMTHAWTMAGAAVTFGKEIKFDVYGGRVNAAKDTNGNFNDGVNIMDVAGIELYNNRKNKFTYGIGYMALDGLGPKLADKDRAYGEDKASIIHAGLGYKFSNKLGVTAAYAKNSKGKPDSKERTRMDFELKYGNANKAKPGSWEAWVSYLHYGKYSGLYANHFVGNNSLAYGTKGLEVGAKVTLEKNIDAQVRYFDGKYITDQRSAKNDDYKAVFTEVNFFF